MTEEIRELDAQEEMETPEESDETDRDLDVESREPSVPISELRKVRAEAAKYRKQLRHLESKIEKDRKAVEFAKMEETDRLKAIAKEAEEKARSIQRRANTIAKQSTIINAASAIGFHNPQDAASMINPLTGEGIFYGMEAGLQLGRRLSGATKTQEGLAHALVRYEREFRRTFTWHFRGNYYLRKLIEKPVLFERMLRAGAKKSELCCDCIEYMMGNESGVGKKPLYHLALNTMFA